MNVYTCIERLSLVQRKIKNVFRQKKDGIIAESWEISVHKDGESTISGTDKTFAGFLKENKNAVDLNGANFPCLLKIYRRGEKSFDAGPPERRIRAEIRTRQRQNRDVVYYSRGRRRGEEI